MVKPFDWSYTTDYKGTVGDSGPRFEKTTAAAIPVELLKRPDPILFFDNLILYEDELADNGASMLSCKIRVMPARLLLLSRFFMRLDNVIFRLRDTRIYIDFESREVIREYQAKECDYATIRKVLSEFRVPSQDPLLTSPQFLANAGDAQAIMRDSNRLSDILPLVEKTLERAVLPE